jgi:DNA repair protein RecN (Recombination protein N)
VRRQARRWAEAEQALAELARGGEVGERLSFLEHQQAELQREQLEPDAIEGLLAGHRRQSSAAALAGGLRQRAGPACRRGRTFAGAQPRAAACGTFPPPGRRAAACRRSFHCWSRRAIQADEAASQIERLLTTWTPIPAQLQDLDARLSRLHELARKHRLPMPELAARRDALEAELSALRGAGERAARWKAERAEARDAWREAARTLGASRTRGRASPGAGRGRGAARAGHAR